MNKPKLRSIVFSIIFPLLLSVIFGYLSWKIPPSSSYSILIDVIFIFLLILSLFSIIFALVPNFRDMIGWLLAYFKPRLIPFPHFLSNGTEQSHWDKIKECYDYAYFWLWHNRRKALIMKPPLPIFLNHKIHLENIEFNEWQRFMIGDGPNWDGGILSRISYGFITWYLNPRDVSDYISSNGEIDINKGPIKQMDNFLKKIIEKTKNSKCLFIFDRIVIVNLEKFKENGKYKKYVKVINDQYFRENDNYRIRFIAEDHIESSREAIELFKDMAIFSYDSKSANAVYGYSPKKNNVIPLDSIEYDVIQTSEVIHDFLYLYYSLQKNFIKKCVKNARNIIQNLNQNGHLQCDKTIREEVKK